LLPKEAMQWMLSLQEKQSMHSLNGFLRQQSWLAAHLLFRAKCRERWSPPLHPVGCRTVMATTAMRIVAEQQQQWHVPNKLMTKQKGAIFRNAAISMHAPASCSISVCGDPGRPTCGRTAHGERCVHDARGVFEVLTRDWRAGRVEIWDAPAQRQGTWHVEAQEFTRHQTW